MKIALITDIHFGVRNDNIAFLNNTKKFFDEVFFPYIDKHNIKEVICLGDLFDRRKYINFLTAFYARKALFEPLTKRGLEMPWILGNHDIYYRETTDVSSAKELYNNGPIYGRAITYQYDIPILFVPWICNQNRDQIIDEINKTDAKVVLGHLELAGFEANKGHINENGESADIFQKFHLVLSGHYHHPSQRGNIRYLGANGFYDWNDYNDPRGFHILDTKTLELEFIENPFTIFEKVYYDDVSQSSMDSCDISNLNLMGKIVKLVVKSKNDPAKYDWFVEQIEKQQPLDIQVVEDHLNVDLTDDESIVSESKDTLSIIREFIQQSNNVVNVQKLDDLIVDLYRVAQETS